MIDHQLETINQQCASFLMKGCVCYMEIVNDEPKVLIIKDNKKWFFSDLDPNVIISQLAILYKTLFKRF